MIPMDYITAWQLHAPWRHRAQVETNLHAKASDPDFRDDIVPILRSDIPWNFEAAMQQVATQLIARLPGAPWRSTE